MNHEQEGWAAYAAEQERHAETTARLELMTREARLSREATENAVRTRVSRNEIERALRAADAPEDSMATDDDLIHYQGRAEAVEIVRIMLGWDEQIIHRPGCSWENGPTCDCGRDPERLHACVGCGLELDGDDPNDRCEECDVICICGHKRSEHAVATSAPWCLVKGGCDCHEFEPVVA